jgi:hypothetical protein
VLADRGVVTLGPVKGATGVFTSAVTVDSLKSTKGINATTGTFSGTVTVDSLKSTKGISYAGAGINTTNGVFSGSISVSGPISQTGLTIPTSPQFFTMVGDSLTVTYNGNSVLNICAVGLTQNVVDTIKGIIGNFGQVIIMGVQSEYYPVCVKEGTYGSSKIFLGAATRTLDKEGDRLVLVSWEWNLNKNYWYEIGYSDNE